MKIFIASDHGGFSKKKQLADKLEADYEIFDMGPYELNPQDDYPLYAKKVALAVKENPGSMGVLLCRSGEGMAIAANKIDGIRAVAVEDVARAKETRRDNDSNVLSLSADDLSEKEITEITSAWLKESFSELDRHKRRLEEIAQIEKEAL